MFFPFKIFAHQASYGVHNPPGFYDTFVKHKPKGLSWYGFHVEVKSPTELTFYVLDLDDRFKEAVLGKQIAVFDAKVHREVTNSAIESHARKLAIAKRDDELHEKEKAIVTHYADEILREALGC